MLYQSCWNNLVTGLIVPSSLLQLVNSLFQTCSNKFGTSSANTSCEQLVNSLVTTCLQVCSNLCVFTCVVATLGFTLRNMPMPFEAFYYCCQFAYPNTDVHQSTRLKTFWNSFNTFPSIETLTSRERFFNLCRVPMIIYILGFFSKFKVILNLYHRLHSCV